MVKPFIKISIRAESEFNLVSNANKEDFAQLIQGMGELFIKFADNKDLYQIIQDAQDDENSEEIML